MSVPEQISKEEQLRHTPGPWAVEDPMDFELAIVEAGKEAYEWKFIACCPRNDFDGSVVEANARLIAAAPDMLEALSSLLPGLILDLRYADDDDDKDAMLSRIDTVQDAIAKAVQS